MFNKITSAIIEKMYAVKIELLLINISILFAISINAKIVPLLELDVADIININYLKNFSTEIIGNVFDGYKPPDFIETKNFSDVYYISVNKKDCIPFESLASYHHLKLSIDDTQTDPLEIFDNGDQQKSNYFRTSQNYIGNKYLYGIVKLCRTLIIRNLNIEVIDESDFPIINRPMNYKLLLDKTAIIRFKRNNETHFVSSITTGDCLLQVYVNKAELCNSTDEKQNNFNSHFFESSFYESRVIVESKERDRENKVNEYLKKHGKSLVNCCDYQTPLYFDVLNLLERNVVIGLKLRSLPELSKPVGIQIKKSFSYSALLTSLKPGDIINVDDLKNINSSITVDNMLVDVNDGTINSSFALKYTNCYEYNENDAVKLDFVTYKSYPHYSPESYYKFDVFDETVKRRHYGVDRRYLNRNYKCVKFTICSKLQRRKLIIPTVRVINLGRQTDNNSNIFDGENLVLRYVMNNETHYVTRTEKGNCLFQALIYPNDDDRSKGNTTNSPLLYVGKILSATNDRVLEYRAENYINNLTTDLYRTLMNVEDNHSTRASFFQNFSVIIMILLL